MVQAIVNINENEDRVLNVVKGKFGLKNKSQAINLVIEKYEKEFLEPELRPEYIEKAHKIHKQKSIKVGSVDSLRKRYEK